VYQNPIVTKDRPALRLTVKPINEIGQLELFFNVEMKTEGVDLHHLNSSYAIDMKRNLQEVVNK